MFFLFPPLKKSFICFFRSGTLTKLPPPSLRNAQPATMATYLSKAACEAASNAYKEELLAKSLADKVSAADAADAAAAAKAAADAAAAAKAAAAANAKADSAFKALQKALPYVVNRPIQCGITRCGEFFIPKFLHINMCEECVNILD